MAKKKTQYGQPANYNITPATRSDGEGTALEVDANGNLKTVSGGTGASAGQIQGTAADNAAAVGNPVRVGAKYNSATQTYADGDIADLQADSQGRLKTTSAPLDYLIDDVVVYGTFTEQASLSTASTTSNDLVASTDVSNYKTGIIQLSGTWTGTVTVQGANDNSNFGTVAVFNPGSITTGLSSNMTGNGHYVFPIAHRFIRIRVTTGGTGTVAGTLELTTLPYQALNIGANQIGTWTVQPGNTANTTPWLVSQSASTTGGASFLNIAAGQATTTVKSGAGTLYSIVLNSAATATNTTTIYDNTAGSGTVIGRPAVTTATVPTTLNYGSGMAFSTGLTIVTATANGGDMTVVYK